MVGAAPLSDDLSRQFTNVFPRLDWGQGSGMTETCSVTTMFSVGEPPVMGSAGRLISNTEAKVVNSEGKEVGYDERGELWLRGPQITLGYTNNDKATKETLPARWMAAQRRRGQDQQRRRSVLHRPTQRADQGERLPGSACRAGRISCSIIQTCRIVA